MSQNVKPEVVKGFPTKKLETKKAKQISMSGLVTYNFRSVKSKNRLAFSNQEFD